jgi:hypothetical protein
MILCLFLSVIFFVLGVMHIHWFFGGTFGFAQSLPTKLTGERVLNPKKIDSAIVGFGLISFSVLYLIKAEVIRLNLSHNLLEYTSWIISSIFILRAIGEFKYVGFFKKVKTTTFGKLDTYFFSPICFIIGITGILELLLQ